MQINELNYKEYLLAHLEGELTPAQARKVEEYLLLNDGAAEEWRRLKETKLQPDKSIFFPGKALLMKEVAEEEEENRPKIVPLYRRRIAYAASIAAVLIAGLFLFNPFATDITVPAGTASVEGRQPQSEISGTVELPQENDKAAVASTEVVEPEGRDAALSTGKISADKGKELRMSSEKQHRYNNKENRNTPSGNELADSHTPVTAGENEAASQAVPLRMVSMQYMAVSQPQQGVKAVALENVKINTITNEKDKQPELLADADGHTSKVVRVVNFLRDRISIKKIEEEPETRYALSIQTEKLNIYRTFNF